MKTLIITLEYPPQIGGIASYIYNAASHWPDNDLLIYAPKTKPTYDENSKWRVIRKKPYFTFFWPHWLRLLWQIWRIVIKEHVEIIHVHHVLPVGYVAYIIKKINKIPYYVFFHGTDLEKATKSRWKKRMAKKICFAADKIIVNSVFLQNKFKDKFEDLNKEVVVVNPGPNELFLETIANEEIKKIKAQLALEGKKVIITVARLAEAKGYPRLIHVLPVILKKIPNLVWLIIGDGPKKKLILDLIQKKSLQNVVRYLGEIEPKLLPKYYQVADLFVLLSHPDIEAEEGWGTVFLEAAASGLPVVAGNAGGVSETVENLVTGLMVDASHEEGVVNAVVELLRNEQYAKQMGKKGKERVIKEFAWEKQIKKIL